MVGGEVVKRILWLWLKSRFSLLKYVCEDSLKFDVTNSELRIDTLTFDPAKLTKALHRRSLSDDKKAEHDRTAEHDKKAEQEPSAQSHVVKLVAKDVRWVFPSRIAIGSIYCVLGDGTPKIESSIDDFDDAYDDLDATKDAESNSAQSGSACDEEVRESSAVVWYATTWLSSILKGLVGSSKITLRKVHVVFAMSQTQEKSAVREKSAVKEKSTVKEKSAVNIDALCAELENVCVQSDRTGDLGGELSVRSWTMSHRQSAPRRCTVLLTSRRILGVTDLEAGAATTKSFPTPTRVLPTPTRAFIQWKRDSVTRVLNLNASLDVPYLWSYVSISNSASLNQLLNSWRSMSGRETGQTDPILAAENSLTSDTPTDLENSTLTEVDDKEHRETEETATPSGGRETQKGAIEWLKEKLGYVQNAPSEDTFLEIESIFGESAEQGDITGGTGDEIEGLRQYLEECDREESEQQDRWTRLWETFKEAKNSGSLALFLKHFTFVNLSLTFQGVSFHYEIENEWDDQVADITADVNTALIETELCRKSSVFVRLNPASGGKSWVSLRIKKSRLELSKGQIVTAMQSSAIHLNQIRGRTIYTHQIFAFGPQLPCGKTSPCLGTCQHASFEECSQQSTHTSSDSITASASEMSGLFLYHAPVDVVEWVTCAAAPTNALCAYTELHNAEAPQKEQERINACAGEHKEEQSCEQSFADAIYALITVDNLNLLRVDVRVGQGSCVLHEITRVLPFSLRRSAGDQRDHKRREIPCTLTPREVKKVDCPAVITPSDSLCVSVETKDWHLYYTTRSTRDAWAENERGEYLRRAHSTPENNARTRNRARYTRVEIPAQVHADVRAIHTVYGSDGVCTSHATGRVESSTFRASCGSATDHSGLGFRGKWGEAWLVTIDTVKLEQFRPDESSGADANDPSPRATISPQVSATSAHMAVNSSAANESGRPNEWKLPWSRLECQVSTLTYTYGCTCLPRPQSTRINAGPLQTGCAHDSCGRTNSKRTHSVPTHTNSQTESGNTCGHPRVEAILHSVSTDVAPRGIDAAMSNVCVYMEGGGRWVGGPTAACVTFDADISPAENTRESLVSAISSHGETQQLSLHATSEASKDVCVGDDAVADRDPARLEKFLGFLFPAVRRDGWLQVTVALSGKNHEISVSHEAAKSFSQLLPQTPSTHASQLADNVHVVDTPQLEETRDTPKTCKSAGGRKVTLDLSLDVSGTKLRLSLMDKHWDWQREDARQKQDGTYMEAESQNGDEVCMPEHMGADKMCAESACSRDELILSIARLHTLIESNRCTESSFSMSCTHKGYDVQDRVYSLPQADPCRPILELRHVRISSYVQSILERLRLHPLMHTSPATVRTPGRHVDSFQLSMSAFNLWLTPQVCDLMSRALSTLAELRRLLWRGQGKKKSANLTMHPEKSSTSENGYETPHKNDEIHRKDNEADREDGELDDKDGEKEWGRKSAEKETEMMSISSSSGWARDEFFDDLMTLLRDAPIVTTWKNQGDAVAVSDSDDLTPLLHRRHHQANLRVKEFNLTFSMGQSKRSDLARLSLTSVHLRSVKDASQNCIVFSVHDFAVRDLREGSAFEYLVLPFFPYAAVRTSRSTENFLRSGTRRERRHAGEREPGHDGKKDVTGPRLRIIIVKKSLQPAVPTFEYQFLNQHAKGENDLTENVSCSYDLDLRVVPLWFTLDIVTLQQIGALGKSLADRNPFARVHKDSSGHEDARLHPDACTHTQYTHTQYTRTEYTDTEYTDTEYTRTEYRRTEFPHTKESLHTEKDALLRRDFGAYTQTVRDNTAEVAYTEYDAYTHNLVESWTQTSNPALACGSDAYVHRRAVTEDVAGKICGERRLITEEILGQRGQMRGKRGVLLQSRGRSENSEQSPFRAQTDLPLHMAERDTDPFGRRHQTQWDVSSGSSSYDDGDGTHGDGDRRRSVGDGRRRDADRRRGDGYTGHGDGDGDGRHGEGDGKHTEGDGRETAFVRSFNLEMGLARFDFAPSSSFLFSDQDDDDESWSILRLINLVTYVFNVNDLRIPLRPLKIKGLMTYRELFSRLAHTLFRNARKRELVKSVCRSNPMLRSAYEVSNHVRKMIVHLASAYKTRDTHLDTRYGDTSYGDGDTRYGDTRYGDGDGMRTRRELITLRRLRELFNWDSQDVVDAHDTNGDGDGRDGDGEEIEPWSLFEGLCEDTVGEPSYEHPSCVEDAAISRSTDTLRNLLQWVETEAAMSWQIFTEKAPPIARTFATHSSDILKRFALDSLRASEAMTRAYAPTEEPLFEDDTPALPTWNVVEKGTANFYQPETAREGLRDAMTQLSRGFGVARRVLHERERRRRRGRRRSNLRVEVVETTLRTLPVIFLQIALTVNAAASSVLQGVCNYMEPWRETERRKVAKAPRILTPGHTP